MQDARLFLKHDGNERHVLNFGGGLNSTALLVFLLSRNYPLDEVIFADTGGEVPETYEHLGIIGSYLSQHDVPFKIVRSENGALYDFCMRRKLIPSRVWPWSIRDYKIAPIHAYYRSLNAHVNQYLGISYEERDRARDSGVQYVTNVFPLVDSRLSRPDCIDVIMLADVDLPMPVRSGCFFCPFNSLSRWKEILERHEELYAQARTLEENSDNFPNRRLTLLTLRTLQEKIEKNESVSDFNPRKLCSGECLI